MKSAVSIVFACLLLSAVGVPALHAQSASTPTTITIEVNPTQVPDEQPPRVNYGDAPVGFGPDSWQGPATGKTNWHVRYLADGDALSQLFPNDAATMTINDLKEISYFTKRPAGTQSGRDWWVQIFTRTTGSGDASSWYHDKFINNYNDHTAIGNWTKYSTNSSWTWRQQTNAGLTGMSLADLQSNYGDQLIEMISIQTNSAWNGFDGYIDGLVITLNNGNVGRVNLGAVPVIDNPTLSEVGLALLFVVLAGVALALLRRRG